MEVPPCIVTIRDRDRVEITVRTDEQAGAVEKLLSQRFVTRRNGQTLHVKGPWQEIFHHLTQADLD